MVTRSRSQNSKLVERIMDLGGNPIEIPTIKIEKVQDNKELENEIKNLKDYTYLVLTSKNGVDIFFDKLDEMGLDCRALANIKVCSIGAATSKAIIRRGIKPDIQPEKAVGESLYDELKDIVSKEDKILIPRAKNAREFLVKKLNEISNVTEVVTYESVMDDSKKEEAINALEEGNLPSRSPARSIHFRRTGFWPLPCNNRLSRAPRPYRQTPLWRCRTNCLPSQNHCRTKRNVARHNHWPRLLLPMPNPNLCARCYR